MRRILNLNQPAMVFIKVIGIFIVVIPAVLYGISLIIRNEDISRVYLLPMIGVSFATGIFILVVFLVLIMIEQIQDHYFDVQYRKQRNQKLTLPDGDYECQYCGSRKIQKNDTNCPVCGRNIE